MLRERTAALIEQRDKQTNELAAVVKQVHALQSEVDMKASQHEHAQGCLKASADEEHAHEAELSRVRHDQYDVSRSLEMRQDRKSGVWGKSVSVREDIGGR